MAGEKPVEKVAEGWLFCNIYMNDNFFYVQWL